jgi:hypothetical protein
MGPKVSRNVLYIASPKASRKMSPKMLRGFSRTCCALVFTVAGLIGGQPAAAAPSDKNKAVVAPPTHRGTVVRRLQSAAPTLPGGPEYGFLKHVPPNAIRMPGGYIFVPGLGILGESCDLPTSACSNRYRDIQ